MVDKQDIVFQVINWNAFDYEYDCGEGDQLAYLIKLYGLTEDGRKVSANITKFTPFFFIRVNHKVDTLFIERIREHVIMKLPSAIREGFVEAKVMKKKDFWGFQNNKVFNFVRFTFMNHNTFRAVTRIFQKEVFIQGFHKTPTRYKIYESNIEPFIRFMHIKDINPSGWIKIPASHYEENQNILPTNSAIDINCEWRAVQKVDKDKIAPVVIASFDLECTSSHGDFPVACKDYKKASYDLLQAYNEEKITTSNIIEEIMLMFDHDSPGILSKVFVKDKIFNKSNLNERLIRSKEDILHILRGRVVFKNNKYSGVPKASKDEIMKTLTRKFGTLEGEHWTGMMPKLEGDPIIQIGTTIHRYGETECFFKSIITLGSCSPIDDVHVTVCKTEQELLLKWRDLIVEQDPDVLTGYNIFGFDFAYLYDRAKELGVQDKLCKIGRILDKVCPYQEKMLASSALGENIMKFIDMDGRIIIDIMKVVQRDHKLDSYKLDNVANHFMNMNKHDVSPNDIFRLYKGEADDRRVIAEYCVQDCALCNKLIMKLEILANNMGMSSVCFVPLSFIFMRGQGVKIFSLVAKQCRNDDFIIPTISKPKDTIGDDVPPEDEEGYEGAIVLDPKEGIYLNDPVSVLDYASLYPSSMISENLSHDCIVLDPKYDNLPGVEYLDITYDVYDYINDKKTKVGEKVCRFVQSPNGEKGVIPRILMKLLKARKDTRKRIEYQTIITKSGEEYSGLLDKKETTYILKRVDGTFDIIDIEDIDTLRPTYGEFEKAVLDGLQLAYKITANSLYGQVGAKTSPVYLKEIAACTTATGRKMICMARDYMLQNYEGVEIIYGDTDSLFVKFPINPNNETLDNKEKIKRAWDMGCHASDHFKKLIKPPHDLEMEKVMFPFILFSKKRYCAYKYEGANAKPKMNSMGIALKRRDNAPIVKHIYGGCLDIILNEQDVKKSIEFLKSNLEELINGKFPLESLVITKSLRADYKDPEKIAHKVLAERMGERDPGNKPMVNDRIPFVYVQPSTKVKKGEKLLQGDRIEHPDYIRAMDLKPDYEFYITNQIMKPVLQLYALTLENISGYKKGAEYFKDVEKKLIRDKEGDMKKVKDKWHDLRETEVKKILFEPLLNKLNNKKHGNREITEFFSFVSNFE